MSKRATGLAFAMMFVAALFIIIAINALKGKNASAEENVRLGIVSCVVDVEAAALDNALRDKMLCDAINAKEKELNATFICAAVGRLSSKGIPMKYSVIFRKK